ncbi:MAG: 3-deoxy-manno-octulosonate cytidylyltransferase [Puniceicoccales bacterium]|jgi:3-deoxy-manno-octulosonate cytidylyltransferase (CMP-KDO synthetase)|nr:3-deoxy-manno-octulosonate cytidylyltransferase [Puniceicoccales bacterium]
MKISIAIPAHFASTRLPRKLLLDLAGHPLLQHTWKRASALPGVEEVVILADHEEILDTAKKFGATVWMTDVRCCSGTARIASVAERFRGDFILNVQGDEPFIDAKLLADMRTHAQDFGGDILTAAYRISTEADLENPNRVKVVLGQERQALYFSRSPIPFLRGVEKKCWLTQHTFWAHIGLYGYTKNFLRKLPDLPRGVLAEAEKLEQLQFLEAGHRIHVLEATQPTRGIDTLEDLERARRYLAEDFAKGEV